MAIIVLDPDESFEHYHISESRSVNLRGKVTIEMLGRSEELILNHVIDVPANCSHTLINTGPNRAYIRCDHIQPKPPKDPHPGE